MIEHIKDLADRCYRNNIYTFTDFLSLADISEFLDCQKDFKHVPYDIWGGCEEAERKMIRFGSEETLGYTEEYPIKALRIEPVLDKFSDELNHRDFLGAVMNLGIERDKVGDIFVKGHTAVLFVKEELADFVIDNLSKIKHTQVKVSVLSSVEGLSLNEKKEMAISVASERVDCVIAGVYNLSRNEASEMFKTGRIYLNGRLMENESRKLVPGDVVSVRGHGKFVFKDLGGLSRKGKQYITVELYV